MALNSYVYFINPQAYTANRVASHSAFVAMYGVTLLCLMICLGLSQTRLGQQYPGWLFVGLSWSNTMPYQVFATLHGIADPRIDAWSLLFPTQAALMPVCLSLHLISQLGLVVYFLVVNALLGLTIHHQSVYSHLTLWIWLFWLFLICDFAVYLYEKLQQSEFESKRELRLFLHAVSHDLRSPATGVSIVLNNLLKKAIDNKIRVDVSVIQRLLQGNHRQLALIDSLLEAHQAETQGVSLCLQSLEIGVLVDAVLSDLAEVLEDAHTYVENHIHSKLPLVQADSIRIWRVYTNLISNAIRHNAPGVKLTLDAEIVKTNDKPWLRCTVQDDGIGISPEQQSALFKLYARRKQNRYRSGLGLGLYLCQQIIVAHGGEIGVWSANACTTFWFTLPLAPSQH